VEHSYSLPTTPYSYTQISPLATPQKLPPSFSRGAPGDGVYGKVCDGVSSEEVYGKVCDDGDGIPLIRKRPRALHRFTPSVNLAVNQNDIRIVGGLVCYEKCQTIFRRDQEV